MNRRFCFSQRALELFAALREWMVEKILPVEGEEIERDVRGGRLLREQLHPRGRWMDAEQERLEGEAFRPGDDDLSVEDAALGNLTGERLDQLREVTVERLQLAALQIGLAAIAEDETAESVPFRLVEEVVPAGEVLGQFRQHGLDGRLQHAGDVSSAAPQIRSPSPPPRSAPGGLPRGSSPRRSCRRPRFRKAAPRTSRSPRPP